jgi:hypothetical protein
MGALPHFDRTRIRDQKSYDFTIFPWFKHGNGPVLIAIYRHPKKQSASHCSRCTQILIILFVNLNHLFDRKDALSVRIYKCIYIYIHIYIYIYTHIYIYYEKFLCIVVQLCAILYIYTVYASVGSAVCVYIYDICICMCVWDKWSKIYKKYLYNMCI